MWLLLPYGSDAPLYHRPWTTGVLAVSSVAMSIASFFGAISSPICSALGLSHGSGLRPWQWITSSLVHDQLLHVIVAPLFFVVFGTIVEGKVGWWRMLLLVLAFAAVGGAIQQLFALNAAPHVSGPGLSTIAWGVLGLSMVWAAGTDIRVVGLAARYGNVGSGFHTLRPWAFVLVFGFLEMLSAFIVFAMLEPASPYLVHLLGLPMGIGCGVWMFKTGRVDCDGLDWFSQRHPTVSSLDIDRTYRKFGDPDSLEELEAATQADPDADSAHRCAAEAEMRASLQAGRAPRALDTFDETAAIIGAWKLEESLLVSLARGLVNARRFEDALGLLEEGTQRFSQRGTELRLLWAEALVELARPISALDVVESLRPDHALSEGELAARDGIMERIERLREKGVLELDVDLGR